VFFVQLQVQRYRARRHFHVLRGGGLWIYLAVTDLCAANRNEGCYQLAQTLKELKLIIA
jgi:hypothetical protein